MLEPTQIVDTQPEPAAVIHLTIPRSEIQRVMGPAIGELYATLAAQGIAAAGPLFSHHLRMDPATFDFELGVPVTAPVAAAGRVQPGELPAARVIRTIYRGPYEGLGAAWGEFCALIAASGYGGTNADGHATLAGLWERYLTGPESNSDPSTWITELNQPIAR